MYHFEPSPYGTRPSFLYEDSQAGSFNPMQTRALSDSGQLADYTAAALYPTFMYDGQDGGHMPDGGVTELLDGGQYFHTDDNIFYDSTMETEQDHRPPMSASSFDSVVSDSKFTSGPTMSSSPEQGVDSAGDLDYIFEGINTAYESMSVRLVENDGSLDLEGSMINPEIDVVLPETDMFKGVSTKSIDRKRKRGVESNKYPSEIRISKKMIHEDGKYLKDKAWLGTCATPDQARRAHDVGKYFLCTKPNKTFPDPNSKSILSALKDHFHAQPLTELVGNVKELAKYYSENGSLPQSLNIL